MAMEGVVVKTENDSDEEWGALSAVKKEPDCDWEATVKLENELMLETDACEALSAGFPPDGRQYAPQQNRTPITVPEICTIIYPDKISIKSEPVFVEEAVITPTTDPLSCEPTDTFSVDPLKCESADLYVDPLKCEPEDSPSADPLHLEPAGVETKDPKKDFSSNIGLHIPQEEAASLIYREKWHPKLPSKFNVKTEESDERPTFNRERGRGEFAEVKLEGGYEGTAPNIMSNDTTMANAGNQSFFLGSESSSISSAKWPSQPDFIGSAERVEQERLQEASEASEVAVRKRGRPKSKITLSQKLVRKAKKAERDRRRYLEKKAVKHVSRHENGPTAERGRPRLSEEQNLERKERKRETERPEAKAEAGAVFREEHTSEKTFVGAIAERNTEQPTLNEDQELLKTLKALGEVAVRKRGRPRSKITLAQKLARKAKKAERERQRYLEKKAVKHAFRVENGPTAGRGRPRLSEEQKLERKERKRERDRLRYKAKAEARAVFREKHTSEKTFVGAIAERNTEQPNLNEDQELLETLKALGEVAVRKRGRPKSEITQAQKLAKKAKKAERDRLRYLAKKEVKHAFRRENGPTAERGRPRLSEDEKLERKERRKERDRLRHKAKAEARAVFREKHTS